MISTKTSTALRASSAVCAITLALLSAPSFAQDASTTAPAPTPPPSTATAPQATSNAEDDSKTIVVTGSIIRNANAASAAPITVLSSQDLAQRGITTIADALQNLAANNGGTMPPSWSAFGFATGASAPSLRGLNDAYTLTLFDGLRSAVYPLADDGYRNFVDINSIPESIVDNIDVLQEGASSAYGADAIAGVVNVKIKKEIKGLHLDVSGGISQKGDAGEQKASASYGYGDLAEQGFNFYVNGEYQHNAPVYLRQRGGTADQSSICDAAGSCLTNSIGNGIQADGSYSGFTSTPVGYARPYVNGAGVGQYQLLNPAAGCQGLPSIALTAAQMASAPSAPSTVCQYDNVANNYQYASDTKRWGANAHLTVNIGSNAQAYAMFNYYEVKTAQQLYYQLNFSGGQIQTPFGTNFMPSPIQLPVYVCPQGVGNPDATLTGCNASNGVLNPNNPFAAQGQVAALSERFNQTSMTLTDSKTFRFSGGINGSFGDGWSYNVDATTSWVDLSVDNVNYLNGQDLLNAIATGSYNFVDQNANSAAAFKGIAPDDRTKSSSRLTEIQVSLQKDLFKLPGGPLTVAIGGAYRFEALNNPSANPGDPNNIYSGWVTVNPVGAIGSRRVYSGFYEVDAPIFDMLTVQAQGRYDSYSSGQSNFSPKFTAEFKPIEQVKFRGTYSKGFRIPSFNQAFGFPTTGYVQTSINCQDPSYVAFCAGHASNPAYYNSLAGGYQYGLTSTGNSSLAPEKSESYTIGMVVQPTRNITLSVDYFHTKISNIIIPASPDQSLIAEYYANNGVVANAPSGVQYIKGSPDPDNPNALPLLGFIQASYTNANKEVVSGLDFAANARFGLGHGLTLTSKFSASYLIRLAQTLADGTVQEFDGSLSPCAITSCSGSPALRGNWSNTLDVNDKYSFTLTAYYTSGYSLASTDYGGDPTDCAGSIGASVIAFPDGTPVRCRAHASFDMDLTGAVKLQEGITVYANIINVLNSSPVYDPSAAYSLYQFNPAWDDKQFIGRYFRIGAKVDF